MNVMYPSLMADLVGIDALPHRSVQFAAAHGFAGVDLRLTRYLGLLENYGADRFLDHMNEHGVRAGYGSMLTRTLAAADDEWDHMIGQLPRIASLAQHLGFTRAGVVVLPFDDRLDFAANYKRHLDRLKQTGPVLADHGIRVGLEYVSPRTRRADATFTFVHDLKGILELIDESNQANVGLMLDSFHWHAAGESVDDLLPLSPEQVVVVHVNDAPDGVEVDQLDIRNRCLPGETGVIDLNGFLGTLLGMGYEGPVTAEPTNPRWPATDDDEAAELTGDAVRGSLEQAGVVLPERS
ncbi:MAG: sugar phosphate isomerase/epimerase [Planctomycetota bacterium]